MNESTVTTIPTALPDSIAGDETYLSLWELRRATADPITFLERQAGRGDIARFNLHMRPVFLISHPAHIEQVLVTQADKFRKAPALQRARRLLGNGLLTAEPPLHTSRRRLIQPAFHRQRLERYADVMVSHAVRTRDRWANGHIVDLVHEMTTLALAVVGESLFGEDLAPYERRLGRVLATALASLDPLVALVAPRKRLQPARERLLAIVAEIIERRRREGRDGDDLLGLLIGAAEDPGDEAQLHDDVLAMLLAGHDTIANAMTWTWTCLANAPEVDARLGSEIDTVLNGRLPSVKDLPALAYTRGVLSEALRLRPPAWLLARSAVEATTIGSAVIPAGAIVLMSSYIVHRDPRFFADPLAFRPERWLDAETRTRPRLSFFPFGAGRRSCVGEPFAWMEGVLVLSVLAGRWRLELAGEPGPIDLRITLRPRGAVGAVPRERRAAVAQPPVVDINEPSSAVRDLLTRRLPSISAADALADDMPLGAEGLGLDSVGIVELLLECESSFGVRLPADLAESGGLTVGRLVALLDQAVGGARDKVSH